MIWLVTFFVRRGLSERVAKPLAVMVALVAGALLLWAGWAAWLHFHDRAVIARHETKITDHINAISTEAAASASAAVAQSKSEVEQANDDARKAAEAGDDPLRDGLDRLRAGQGSPSAPAR